VLYAPVDVILDRASVVEPDIVFIARCRLSLIGEHAIEGAPDLVVEIHSPSTEQRDRGIKQELYARYGVAHCWRVDPNARSITELVLKEGAYTLRATYVAPASMRSALFPELTIDLGAVFANPAL